MSHPGHRLRHCGSAVGDSWSDAKIGFFTRFKDRLKAEPSGLESRKKRTPTPFPDPISTTKQGLRRWGLQQFQLTEQCQTRGGGGVWQTDETDDWRAERRWR
ncbi:hypothetical protein ES332_D04G022900v1 [Gossypium tomentosum]|uniref:Uncharacterized protein n=1 Tax=Gossypium tomentosum TaxID=34277 RepID=A0A5D2L833_GOSTO|nr:hypothetical protein ES332_D04G022900v1 [Gossypium tomentosum]